MASSSRNWRVIEIKVLVKNAQPQWKQVQFRFAWCDGSEMACFVDRKAVESLDMLEVERIYIMTIPGSCVQPVKDPWKSGVDNAQEIRITEPISWSLAKAHWPTKVQMQPIDISAINKEGVGEVFDVIG